MSKSVWLDTYKETINTLLKRLDLLRMRGTFPENDISIKELVSLIKGLVNECMRLSEELEKKEK